MPSNPLSYNAIFISEQVLKEQSILSANQDMKTLAPIIKLVQDIYLTRLLGTGLFVHLQNQIASNILTDDEKFLLNAYIQPVMIWGIQKETPIFLTYKVSNKGTQKMDSDNSQPASLDELQMLVDKAGDRFDWYSQRLIDYLTANRAKYPSYNTSETTDDITPAKRGFSTRLYLGGDDDNCTYYS